MPDSILHTVSDEFDSRNAFLQVTLGALGFAARFDALLARHAVAPLAGPEPGTPTDDHPLPYLLLGLVAVRERLRAVVDAARSPERPAPVSSPVLAVSPRTLLA
jgi:hypothetical protein